MSPSPLFPLHNSQHTQLRTTLSNSNHKSNSLVNLSIIAYPHPRKPNLLLISPFNILGGYPSSSEMAQTVYMPSTMIVNEISTNAPTNTPPQATKQAAKVTGKRAAPEEPAIAPKKQRAPPVNKRPRLNHDIAGTDPSQYAQGHFCGVFQTDLDKLFEVAQLVLADAEAQGIRLEHNRKRKPLPSVVLQQSEPATTRGSPSKVNVEQPAFPTQQPAVPNHEPGVMQLLRDYNHRSDGEAATQAAGLPPSLPPTTPSLAPGASLPPGSIYINAEQTWALNRDDSGYGSTLSSSPPTLPEYNNSYPQVIVNNDEAVNTLAASVDTPALAQSQRNDNVGSVAESSPLELGADFSLFDEAYEAGVEGGLRYPGV